MKQQAKITVLVIAICFFGFSFLCWVKPMEEYSATERRKLEQFPELSLETVNDGSFMSDFETYTMDQFPMRDGFRSLKAWISQNVFFKKDNNEIYVADGYAAKMEYPLKEESITNATKKFSEFYENYLKEKCEKIYVSVIPDKNYFLGEKHGYLTMDYERLFEMVKDEMSYAEYIDITDLLEIEDYYQTDIHWREEQIVDVAQRLGACMGVEVGEDYEQKTLENPFYGVYFGQSALNLPGEPLHYLTNPILEQCVVYNYENNQTLGIYDMKKAEGKDPYEIFLSGSVSLMKIENPNAASEKELVVFRDSFGSSLIPLLAEGYRTITLVDIRYIQSAVVPKYVEFEGKDVLFLYSATVLNNSETFK